MLLTILVAASSALSSPQYAPEHVKCPKQAIHRLDTGLGLPERLWLEQRDRKTQAALINWLTDSALDGFDPSDYSESQIRIGLAVSGGGYRAMLTGAGCLAALDGREQQHKGSLGGLLQASTYLTGLSGGSFLVSSFAANEGKNILDMVHQDWDIAHSFLTPHGTEHLLHNIDSLEAAMTDLKTKQTSGFNTSITDWYGRLISPQLFRGTSAEICLSDVRDFNTFKQGDMPLPVLVTVARKHNKITVDADSNIYEMSPFEFGSWDSSVHSFTDMKYLGSKGHDCVTGLDNIGFITAVSTSFFNGALIDLLKAMPGFAAKAVQSWLGTTTSDVAHVPFNGEYLELVDGGEDGQSIPLYPLLQPSRQLDLVLAFDITADTFVDSPLGTFSPSGRAMVATFERQFNREANHTTFPYVPDDTTFIYGGLVEQPTFFGCDRDNLTSLFTGPFEANHYPPLVVYIANSQHTYSPYANTFQMKFEQQQINGLVNNGYNIMTQNNGTIDQDWRKCLACASVLRDQQRRNISPTPQCQDCFDRYCWDGSLHSARGKGARRDGRLNIAK